MTAYAPNAWPQAVPGSSPRIMRPLGSNVAAHATEDDRVQTLVAEGRFCKVFGRLSCYAAI